MWGARAVCVQIVEKEIERERPSKRIKANTFIANVARECE